MPREGQRGRQIGMKKEMEPKETARDRREREMDGFKERESERKERR